MKVAELVTMRRSGKRPSEVLVFSFVGSLPIENALFTVFEDDLRPFMGLHCVMAIHKTTSIDKIAALLIRLNRVRARHVDIWYPQTGHRRSILRNGQAKIREITDPTARLRL